ncbi:MAG: peroxide stress protein YaaA [Pseudomonadota bacterium]
MLFLLSPAKTLDFDTPVPAQLPCTEPPFTAQAAQLIEVLRRKSPQEIASLMGLSDKLAALNVARYQAWQPQCTPSQGRQALLAFNGDVYEGLQARTLGAADLDWAQQHLVILSGLYGVLRPLDCMLPYRLEMGTPLATTAGANLYQFWGPRIADYLNAALQAQEQAASQSQGQEAQGHEERIVVNLASQEYFKAVDRKALRARVIDCVFEDFKGGGYKIISFYAKRARGLMARYAITQRVTTPAGLEGFALEGYAYARAASTPDRLVFRRAQPGAPA